MSQTNVRNRASDKIRGVRDWPQKVAVIRVLLNAFTIGDIADKIYPDNIDMAVKAAAKFKTWAHSTPTQKSSLEFFDRLADRMGCVSGTTGAMLVNASIERFIQFVEDNSRWDIAYEAIEAAGLEDDEPGVRILGSDGVFPAGPRLSSKFRNVLVPRAGRLETISHGIRHGKISEKHYYLTPEAAITWQDLVNADSYPTYDQCRAGLRALTGSPEWNTLLNIQSATAAVMLCGGGSPTKDVTLIRALLNQPAASSAKFDYVLLDVSHYMLVSSVWWLEEALATILGGDRVNLVTICEDVRREFDRSNYDRGDGRTLFGITGGTIGNLRESQFFTNIPSEPGDLLIVSAETLPKNDPTNISSLIEKYSHREMEKFVAPAIHALIRHFDLKESFAQAYERVKVHVAEGDVAHSDVPGSASVMLTARIDDEQVTLLSSTRYLQDELIRFAQQYGWEHRVSVPSPSNPNFTQFLFEKSR